MQGDNKVEQYAVKENIWFNTKLEYDKNILILSTAAIGLLTTLLATIGVSSITLLILFVAALISFIVCLVSILIMFSRNARHLEGLIQDQKTRDSALEKGSTTSISSFISGAILTSIIGVVIASNNGFLTATEMTAKNTTKNKITDINDSVNDAQNSALISYDNSTPISTGSTYIGQPKEQGTGNYGDENWP